MMSIIATTTITTVFFIIIIAILCIKEPETFLTLNELRILYTLRDRVMLFPCHKMNSRLLCQWQISSKVGTSQKHCIVTQVESLLFSLVFV